MLYPSDPTSSCGSHGRRPPRELTRHAASELRALGSQGAPLCGTLAAIFGLEVPRPCPFRPHGLLEWLCRQKTEHPKPLLLRMPPQSNEREDDTEGIRTPAGRAQWISSPSPSRSDTVSQSERRETNGREFSPKEPEAWERRPAANQRRHGFAVCQPPGGRGLECHRGSFSTQRSRGT